MEITYLGQSCFKLKNKSGMTLLMDPFENPEIGLTMGKESADIVTVSHDHSDHNAVSLVTSPVIRPSIFTINAEGEYEIGGVEISMMRTFHDTAEGAERGKNLVTCVRMDGVNILHLGDLGHKLTESQMERIGSVDVLMIGVGGVTAMELDGVMDTINDLQPSYVIPMHYKLEQSTGNFAKKHTLQEFLDKSKFVVAGEPVHKIKVDPDSLPEDTQVLIMNV